MKSISAALEAHYASGSLTIAKLWKVTRIDGQVFGFTNIDRDIVYLGITYESSTGIEPSALQSNASFAVDNLEMKGFLAGASLTAAEINAGRWDYAALEEFEVNWKDLTMGHLIGPKGKLGQIVNGRTTFTVEFRGMAQAFTHVIGELYGPGCRADLYDARCMVNPAAFTFTDSVDTVTSNRTIAASALTQANGYFNAGKITFTSGLNNGLSMEVKSYTVGVLVLQLPMPYAIAVGDTFSVRRGCNKIGRLGDCKLVFNNYVNFRGEEDLPGLDKILEVGGR
jgi:uncharacterized phage protein (TIGR02218 family)